MLIVLAVSLQVLGMARRSVRKEDESTEIYSAGAAEICMLILNIIVMGWQQSRVKKLFHSDCGQVMVGLSQVVVLHILGSQRNDDLEFL